MEQVNWSITNHLATTDDQLLTVAEVAEYLRVSRVTVWRWCHEGAIPAFRVGRLWRIRKQDLLEMQTRSEAGN
jgi:excisionase family DNA binding protein